MSSINLIIERTEEEAGGSELVGDRNKQILPFFHLMADGHLDKRATRS